MQGGQMSRPGHWGTEEPAEKCWKTREAGSSFFLALTPVKGGESPVCRVLGRA